MQQSYKNEQNTHLFDSSTLSGAADLIGFCWTTMQVKAVQPTFTIDDHKYQRSQKHLWNCVSTKWDGCNDRVFFSEFRQYVGVSLEGQHDSKSDGLQIKRRDANEQKNNLY